MVNPALTSFFTLVAILSQTPAAGDFVRRAASRFTTAKDPTPEQSEVVARCALQSQCFLGAGGRSEQRSVRRNRLLIPGRV